ncbi:MAG: DUF4258 domain-containing protein [Geminicoccaceae bacterium]
MSNQDLARSLRQLCAGKYDLRLTAHGRKRCAERDIAPVDIQYLLPRCRVTEATVDQFGNDVLTVQGRDADDRMIRAVVVVEWDCATITLVTVFEDERGA